MLLLQTQPSLQRPSCFQRPQRQCVTAQVVARAAPAATAADLRAQSDLMTLVPWAVKNNIQFAKIKPAIQPGSGRGLVATTDIQAGECLLSVPVSVALRVFPGCPAVLQVPQPLWQQLPWYGQLALTLLAEQQKGPDSRWHDYIQQLPAQVDVPVLWSEAAVQQLRCGYFIEQVQQQQAEWAKLQQQLSPYLTPAGVSTDRLHWALSITRSRTFAAPYASNPLGMFGNQQQQQQQQHVMCPFLDLFNHRGDVQSECEFFSSFRGSVFRVVASQQWRRGEQVFINYGSSSNDTLLQLYGFVEAGNSDDRFIVRSLPTVLAQLGCADAAAVSEVVLTRHGLEGPAAARISELLQNNGPGAPQGGPVSPQAVSATAGGSSSASTSTVPYSALSQPVRAAVAAALQLEVAALAVDPVADEEVLQAYEQLPVKEAELEAKQQDLSKARGRLEQLQQLVQTQDAQAAIPAAAAEHPGGEDAAEGQQQQQHARGVNAAQAAVDETAEQAAAAAASVQEELLSTRHMCSTLCDTLSAQVQELEQLLARWQQLRAQHERLVVMYRLEKHKLLTEVLEQLA